MKFLIDNQLPEALSDYLTRGGHGAVHVRQVKLDTALDLPIWEFARTRGLAIVSKDEDFLHLTIADPGGPPFAWVRLGNCRTPHLLAAFERALPQMLEAFGEGQKVVEIR